MEQFYKWLSLHTSTSHRWKFQPLFLPVHPIFLPPYPISLSSPLLFSFQYIWFFFPFTWFLYLHLFLLSLSSRGSSTVNLFLPLTSQSLPSDFISVVLMSVAFWPGIMYWSMYVIVRFGPVRAMCLHVQFRCNVMKSVRFGCALQQLVTVLKHDLTASQGW